MQASPQPVVKASDGPPWQIDGGQDVSVLVTAPREFSAGTGFEVPANSLAVILPFELQNGGGASYFPAGFTVSLASSDPCEAFSYLSEGVAGVPEVVEPGATADFKFGYFCKGDSGDSLTLKVGVDPNSPIARIKTIIP